jgi:site-specific DNA recombinase
MPKGRCDLLAAPLGRAGRISSITQQFNTTSSMGRLTLNVLLSFAQFEREMIGERVRDKIAASKKKGLWMGGMPPLGYDVNDRKLVVNADEARIVVDIYRRYLALKSVRALQEALVDAGIKSKRRMRPNGAEYGGQTLSRGALYLILQNRIYRGETLHNGHSYPGEHAAIVEKPLWDEVQALLAANRVERATGACARCPSLLTRMVFNEAGGRLTPTHAVKKKTRYRYYVSTSLITGVGKDRSSGRQCTEATEHRFSRRSGPRSDLIRGLCDKSSTNWVSTGTNYLVPRLAFDAIGALPAARASIAS